VKESSAEDQYVLPITTTNQPSADESATCISDSEKESNGLTERADAGTSDASPDELPAATPKFVVRVSPPLQNQLLTSSPTWSDIVEAADRLRHQLGISRAAWIDACFAISEV
jgi:replication initiation protein RepC